MKTKKRRILTARTNQYGNIALSDGKDKDGRIVHVSGQRLSVTCRAKGFDYRLCVAGFRVHGGAYHPDYDGVYVAAEDAEHLKQVIKDRDDRKAKREQEAHAATLLKCAEENRRKEEHEAAWLAEFASKYLSAEQALPDVCEALYHLNHWAKLPDCQDPNAIYTYKNAIIEHLYHNGYCTEAIRHTTASAERECLRCYGSGYDGGRECCRCGGTGYITTRRVSYIAFRFLIMDKKFSWHQPEHTLAFVPQLTGPDSPMSTANCTSVPVATCDIEKALFLVQWFVALVSRRKAA